MIAVTVLVNGEAHAQRKWPSAPAVGDVIELDAGGTRSSWFEVVRLIWRRPVQPGDCSLDVHVKPTKWKPAAPSPARRTKDGGRNA